MTKVNINPQIVLRPQDLVVLFRLALEQGPPPIYAVLASELSLTASEIHASVDRAVVAQLARKDRAGKASVVREALCQFVLNAARYALPATRGGTRMWDTHRFAYKTAHHRSMPVPNCTRDYLSRHRCNASRHHSQPGWSAFPKNLEIVLCCQPAIFAFAHTMRSLRRTSVADRSLSSLSYASSFPVTDEVIRLAKT